MHIDVTTTVSLKSDQGYELLRYTGKAQSMTWDGTEEITEETKTNLLKRVSIAVNLAKKRASDGIEGFVRALQS